MKITYYLTNKVLFGTAISGLLLVIVYVCVDFVEVASALKLPLGNLLIFYPARLPLIICHTLPIALTVGLQLTLASAKRDGEWDALESAGVSRIKICATLLIVPFVAVLISGLLLMQLSPLASRSWQDNTSGEQDTSAIATKWCKHQESLVSKSLDGKGLVEVERDSTGTPLTLRKTDIPGKISTWRRGEGWTEADYEVTGRVSCQEALQNTFSAAPMAMIGASMTAAELFDAIDVADNSGWSTAPLEAEFGLRIALCLACLVVPLFALGLGLKKRETGTTLLVAKGVFAAALFWLFLASAWNGAALGAWSSIVVCFVPVLFFAVGCVLVLVFGDV